MWHYVNEGLWFYLPALVANLGLYVVWSATGDTISIDLDRNLGGVRILGNGRQIIGLPGFFVFAIIVGIWQNRPIESLYLGIGGNFGCILSSFIKRRLRVKRGVNFFPLDQLDFFLGATLFYISAYHLEWGVFWGGLVACLGLHVLVNMIFRRKSDSFFKNKP